MKLYKLTAHEAHDLLRKREVSAVELTSSVLERIREAEPAVKALVTVSEELA
ncbi:MAG: Asp-tRNA(Asn)/Glu-tRNA(Gln) amidotransferase subunit GatA, partial [Chloroflexi bacterium]|nr:Asp-tRNA(Asn)/Glu-tRNA(Gln) amidotransferase subunit GatA [Chloroflexota bacterium]